jgi:N-acetylglucosamine kinase-like BadF-type ATPase
VTGRAARLADPSGPAGQLPAVLAIDGGNSKTDIALVAADGTVLARVRGPGSNFGRDGAEPTMRVLGDLVRELAAAAGPPPGLVAAHTSACLANADLPEDEERLAGVLAAQGWSRSTTLVNDTFAVLRSGLRGTESWGVAVTCGAGINCVGVAPDGQVTRFLALGHLTGDRGGGGELATMSLWSAMRAEDGRGPQTMLRTAVAGHFGVPLVRDAAIGLYTGTISMDLLFSLVPVLLRTARDGDEVARALVREQADEITTMALTAMRRLDLTSAAVPVVLGGGVLTARDPLLTELIVTGVTAGAARADIRIADVPPIAGAALLGLDHLDATVPAKSRLLSAYQPTPPPPPPPPAPPPPAPAPPPPAPAPPSFLDHG